MAEFTISIPDKLAQRLEPLQDRLPELLSQLVEGLSPSTISAYRLSLVAQPTDATLAREEVLEFLLNRPTPEAIVAFKVSPAAQARIRALLENNREATLNTTETAELDLCEQLEHLMMLLKAKARTQLK
jgi:hypothetical protein